MAETWARAIMTSHEIQSDLSAARRAMVSEVQRIRRAEAENQRPE
jgi:hypothetical protein